MKVLLQTLVLMLGLLVAAGCKDKGPVPEADPSKTPAPQVGMAETTGAHPGAANPHAGTGDPHAGLDMGAPGSAVAGQPNEEGMIDVGTIAFKLPDAWSVQRPQSSMRRAQLAAEGPGGPAELVVYFFGARGAGTAEENIERWVGQFTTKDGKPVTERTLESLKVAGHDITRLEVAGTYSSGMAGPNQPETPVGDQRMIAAIVYTAGGPYYFKFLGPDETVAKHADTFDGLLSSIVAAQ